MRTRVVPQLLVGLVVAGSLAACGLPGGGDPGARLVSFPPAAVFDLPDDGEAQARQTVTITNLGSEGTGFLDVDLIGDPEGFVINSPGGDCPFADNLAPGDSCELEITITGNVPSEPFEAGIRLFGADSGDITVPIFVF